MNHELKTKWVAALRSGEYEQAQGTLRREAYDSLDGKERFCCLGVLCEIDPEVIRERHDGGYEFQGQYFDGSLSLGYLDHVDFKLSHEDDLISYNDNDHKDFAFIADWIEENL